MAWSETGSLLWRFLYLCCHGGARLPQLTLSERPPLSCCTCKRGCDAHSARHRGTNAQWRLSIGPEVVATGPAVKQCWADPYDLQWSVLERVSHFAMYQTLLVYSHNSDHQHWSALVSPSALVNTDI